jgi:hypothetical protein
MNFIKKFLLNRKSERLEELISFYVTRQLDLIGIAKTIRALIDVCNTNDSLNIFGWDDDKIAKTVKLENQFEALTGIYLDNGEKLEELRALRGSWRLLIWDEY